MGNWVVETFTGSSGGSYVTITLGMLCFASSRFDTRQKKDIAQNRAADN